MRAHDVFVQLERLEALDPSFQSLKLSYLEGTERERRNIEALVSLAHQEHFPNKSHRILPLPPAAKIQGLIPVGTPIFSNKKTEAFSLTPMDLLRHVAVFGGSGSGKTNLVLTLAMHAANLGIPFLAFDFKKNFRDLIPLLSERLVVLTPGQPAARFTFNPLIAPPGVHQGGWIKQLAEVLSHAYFGGAGVNDTLLQAINEAFKEHKTPTFSHVLKAVLAMKGFGRSAEWRQSTLRILRSLNQPGVREVFDTTSNSQLLKLFEQPVALELDTWSADDRTFLVESLLLWAYHWRLKQGSRERLEQLFIIEEAHAILAKQYSTSKESIIEGAIRQAREIGLGVCLVDQTPSKAGQAILGSIGTIISFNCHTEQDLRTSGHSMLLKDVQLLGKLPVGTAVVKSHTRNLPAFMIEVPKLPLYKGLTSNNTLTRQYQRLVTTKRRSATGTTTSRREQSATARCSASEIREQGLCETATALLNDIAQHPESSIRERYKRLKVSVRRGNNAVNELTEKHLVIKTQVKLQRGGKKTVLRMVPKPGTTKFRGGPEHNAYCRLAKQVFEKEGFQTIAEHAIGSLIVDLYATKEDQAFLILVETGKSSIGSNMQRAKESNAGKVVVIATNQKAFKKALSLRRANAWTDIQVLQGQRLEAASV